MDKIEALTEQMENEIKIRMNLRRERLAEVIKTHHLSYAQLEELTGVAKSSIQRYLTGETAKIPIDFFEKVARVTNTAIEYLTCFNNEKNAPIMAYRDDLTEAIMQLSEESKQRIKELADLLQLKEQYQIESKH